jgi:hypothetical protein
MRILDDYSNTLLNYCMYTKDEALLMMKLSDRILEIADGRSNLTRGEFQNVIDAVIMAAYQEGKNAAVQRLEVGHYQTPLKMIRWCDRTMLLTSKISRKK